MTTDDIMRLVEEYAEQYAAGHISTCNKRASELSGLPAEDPQTYFGKADELKLQLRAALAPPQWHPASEPITVDGWYWLDCEEDEPCIVPHLLTGPDALSRWQQDTFATVRLWSGPISPPPGEEQPHAFR